MSGVRGYTLHCGRLASASLDPGDKPVVNYRLGERLFCTCIIRRHDRRLSRDTRNELWCRLRLQGSVERHTHSRTEYCCAEAGADGLRQSDRVGLWHGEEPSDGDWEILLLRRNDSAEFAVTPIAPSRASEPLRVVPTLLCKQTFLHCFPVNKRLDSIG